MATILVSLGVGGCAVAVGVLGWSDYAAMQRATKARELIVPGMTIDQAKAATADLGDILMPELHPPHPPRAVFWARGGLVGGEYSVIVVLDDQQRVVSTEPPVSDSVD